MNSSEFRPIGVLLLLMGLIVVLGGWRLWRRPDSLRPNSLLYRYLYVDWHTWPRGRRENSGKLTDRQIRYYALTGVLGGIVLIVVGLTLVW